MNRSIQRLYSKDQGKPIFDYRETEDVSLKDFDIKVRVEAISLNPVDYKVGAGVKSADTPPKTLGWDVAGTITAVGSQVKGLAVGDEVYYAGDITRPGGNTEEHVVDSRIAARKPKNLSFLEAAALPLTAITAWEGLAEGLALNAATSKGKTLLVIGGAGGVGSIVTQLAKKLYGMTVIATSSKEESSAWCRKMGADHVVNYKNGLEAELKGLGLAGVDYIFCTNNTSQYFEQFGAITKPFGRIVSVVEVDQPVNLGSLMRKSISFAWEFMFTRSMFQTSDMAKQGEILTEVAKLMDNRTLVTTMNVNLGAMTPESLTKGHELLGSGNAIGKIVLGRLSR